MNAKIESWDPQLGFGFVTLDDGRTAFCHPSTAWHNKFDALKAEIGNELHFVEVDDAPKGLRVIQFVSPEACEDWKKMYPGIDKEKGIKEIKALIVNLARPWWIYFDETLRDKFENEGRTEEDERSLLEHRQKKNQTVSELYRLLVDVLNIHETYSGPIQTESGVHQGSFGIDPYEVSDAVIVAQTMNPDYSYCFWSRKGDIPEFLYSYLVNPRRDAFSPAIEMDWVSEMVWAQSQGLIVF